MIQTTLPFFFSVILHPFRKITGHSSVKEDVEAALVESKKRRSNTPRRNTKAVQKMACKINWPHRAWKTYEANIKYLQEACTEKEINNFVTLVDRKISNFIQESPNRQSPE